MPIIKSTTIKNSAAQQNLLEYVLRPKDQYIDKNGKSLFLKHNVLGKSDDLGYLTKQFLENLEYRKHKRSNNISILHDIIAFSPLDRDKLDVDILKDIAKKYIQERNPLGMYVVSSHQDKESLHLHIIASALEFSSGKSMRLSQEDYSKLQITMNNYQKEKYPELINSEIEYGKDKNKIKKKNPNREEKKNTRLQQMRSIRSRKD